MATSASPEKPPAPSSDEDRRDFGYAAAAAEINSLFAARLREMRRRLPRHEIPFAIASLRLEKAQALDALKARCASDRREARAAEGAEHRLMTRPQHRPSGAAAMAPMNISI